MQVRSYTFPDCPKPNRYAAKHHRRDTDRPIQEDPHSVLRRARHAHAAAVQGAIDSRCDDRRRGLPLEPTQSTTDITPTGYASHQVSYHDMAEQHPEGRQQQSTKPPEDSAQSTTAGKENTRRSKRVSFATDAYTTLSLANGIDFTNTVIISAGEGSTTQFVVHRNLLACSSPFFEELLRPSSGRAGEDKAKIQLPGVHPKGLNIFLHWLYNYHFREPYGVSTPAAACIKHLGYAHVLGQVADITSFRHYCVDQIISFFEDEGLKLKGANAVLAEHVYPAARGTRLSILCVDLLVWQGYRDPLGYSWGLFENKTLRDEMDAAMHKQSMLRCLKKDVRPPYLVNLDRYHDRIEEDKI